MPKILIVDNSPDLLSLFTMVFKTDNIYVDACDSADAMFTCLQSSVPDLMLIDVMSIGVNEQVIRENLRKRNELSAVPIIITSTKKEHINNYKLFGADDAIEKPFELNEMKEKIRSFLPAT